MSSITTLFLSSRVYLLVATLPYSLLWMTRDSSGGVLMVMAHSLLVLFYVLTLDRQMLASGHAPLFALSPDRGASSVQIVDRAHALVGVALGVVAVVLLVAQPWAGVVALAAAALIVLLVAGREVPTLRWRLRAAEFVWPGVVLIGPAMLVHAYAQAHTEAQLESPAASLIGTGDAALAATVLGALLLGVYIHLTLMRDMNRHRAERFQSTPALVGPNAATALLGVWLFLIVFVGAKGVDELWWGWPVGALTGWWALLAMWSAASGREATGVGLWLFGQLVIGATLFREIN